LIVLQGGDPSGHSRVRRRRESDSLPLSAEADPLKSVQLEGPSTDAKSYTIKMPNTICYSN